MSQQLPFREFWGNQYDRGMRHSMFTAVPVTVARRLGQLSVHHCSLDKKKFHILTHSGVLFIH